MKVFPEQLSQQLQARLLPAYVLSGDEPLQLMEAAEIHCGGRIVSVLEGGYDLQGLAASVGIHVQALMRGNAGSIGDETDDDGDDF